MVRSLTIWHVGKLEFLSWNWNLAESNKSCQIMPQITFKSNIFNLITEKISNIMHFYNIYKHLVNYMQSEQNPVRNFSL